MSKKRGSPYLPNLQELISAGIDPRTGLPIKFVAGEPSHLKSGIKAFLRIIDEQDATNRYKWSELPANITSEELERLIYFKGQLAFFKEKNTGLYYFMPYALDGTIDFYGRFNRIHPVPMANGTEEDIKKGKDENLKRQLDLLSKMKLHCIYHVDQINDKKEQAKADPDVRDENMVCVLLHDYTKQISQTIISRQILNEPLLDVMAETVPFLRTAMINSTGVRGVRVSDADASDEVLEGARNVYLDALQGKIWEPITSSIEMQELTDGNKNQGKLQEFMQTLQSLDNLRLSGYGLDNGGMFEKKAHMLDSEQESEQSNVGLVLEDGLQIRKNFCEIVNKVFGLNIKVEIRQVQSGLLKDENKKNVVNYQQKEEGISNDSSNS